MQAGLPPRCAALQHRPRGLGPGGREEDAGEAALSSEQRWVGHPVHMLPTHSSEQKFKKDLMTKTL